MFVVIEMHVDEPMMDMRLFRIRAFSAGQAVNLLAAMSRGGLQFMLIIWLQGIWLPLHGYNFADTPLWAGIYMLPLTIGFLIAGPASGAVSDRFGARAFATGGLLLTALTFVGLILLPANFSYPLFATLLAFNGIGMGLMAAPNSAAIMNAVPASAARRRVRHPGHRHERRHGDLAGRLLHPDGGGAVQPAARRAVARADRGRCPGRPGDRGLARLPRRHAVRVLPRRQPDPSARAERRTARWPRRSTASRSSRT